MDREQIKKWWFNHEYSRTFALIFMSLGVYVGRTTESAWVFLLFPVAFLSAFCIDFLIGKKKEKDLTTKENI